MNGLKLLCLLVPCQSEIPLLIGANEEHIGGRVLGPELLDHGDGAIDDFGVAQQELLVVGDAVDLDSVRLPVTNRVRSLEEQLPRSIWVMGALTR